MTNVYGANFSIVFSFLSLIVICSFSLLLKKSASWCSSRVSCPYGGTDSLMMMTAPHRRCTADCCGRERQVMPKASSVFVTKVKTDHNSNVTLLIFQTYVSDCIHTW